MKYEVLREVLSQGALVIQAAKLLAVPVYLVKKVFFETFDFDL